MADDLSVIGFKANTKGIKDINTALKGMAKQGDKTEDSLDSNASKISSSFDKSATNAKALANSITTVATVAAASGTAVGLLLKNIASTQREMQAAAALAGTTTQEFERMAFVYSQFGVTVEQVTDILKDSTERVGDWLNNQSGALEDFGNAVGMSSSELTAYANSVKDLSGQDLLQDMVSRMEDAGVSAAQMRNAIESMANEASRLIPALSDNGEAIKSLTKLYDNFNDAFALNSSDVAEWNELATNFDLFMTTAENGLTKTLTPLATFINDLELVKSVVSDANGISVELGDGFGYLSESVNAAAVAVGGLATITAGKAVSAMVAARVESAATVKAKVSEAEANYATMKSEASLAASRVSGIKDSVAALEAEIALENQRIKAQINQTGRNASLARVAEIQQARIALTKQLTTAEAELLAVQDKSDSAMRSMVKAQNSAKISTTALATAQRALGSAASFMLGPWGMAITAVGVAATTFITTKNAADLLNEQVDKQVGKVDTLAASWEGLNEAGKNILITKLQSQISDFNSEIASAQTRLSSLQNSLSSADSSTRQSITQEITKYENIIKSNQAAIEEASNTMSEIFSSNLPSAWESLSVDDKTASATFDKIDAILQRFADGDISFDEMQDSLKPLYEILEGEEPKITPVVDTSATDSYKKQLQSLSNQADNVWLQGDALFIAQQVQQAKAAGYSDEMVESIKNQAISYLSAKNEAEEYFSSVEQGKSDFEKLVTSQNDVSESMDWLKEVEDYQTYAESIRNEIDRVNAAIQSGKFDDNSGALAYLAELEETLDSIDNKVATTLGDMSSWAGVISGIAEDGSSAEKDINNIATGLSAAASFASGDYLSAATGAISLLDSLGDVGDAYEADEIQAEQFLDKWDNKLDSIDNSTETAANASEDLVMINTDMLDALQDLSEAIASAASLISGDVDTDLIDNSSLYTANPLSGITSAIDDLWSSSIGGLFDDTILDGLLGSVLGSGLDLLGGLLGGSSSTVDSGIRIVGDYITDLTDDVLVQAYETVKYKKYAWSSSKKKTGYSALDDEISNQFSLVFEGIIDSVGEASTILGLSSDEISDAIADFYVDTTKISLDGLDDDEAADEITAYFSDVFNDLASEVVPYLEDFQDAGEELGDTLTRLATEVSTLEVLFDLGVAFGNLYDASYDLTAAADNIATMLGGDDAFSEAVSSFLSNFASDADMMELYGDTLTESLGDVGLSLSDSADEFYELFKSLDASTEAGQEQIATMLELESTAAAYYDLLESVTDSFDDIKESIWDDDTDDAVTSISQALQDAMRGDFTATEDLLENGVTLDSSDYATAAEYAIAQATASSQLDQLEALYTGQTTIDEQQLDYLEQIANNTADSSSVTSNNEDSTALQSIANDSATQAAKLSTMNKSIDDLSDTVERISNIVGA